PPQLHRRWEGGSMVPGDASHEKLEHQLLFLRERGLTSPEIEECNRRLWLSTRLAGGNSSKLDSQFVDRIHAELAEESVKQLKALGLFEEWLDSWDSHNGIEITPKEPVPAPRVDAEQPTATDNPAERLCELVGELQHSLRVLTGEPVAGVSGEAEKGYSSSDHFEGFVE